jgi:predicted O-methyltransferase YrrM/uncharacterized protein YciI
MWYLALRRDIAPRQTWTATLDEHLAWMKTQHDAGHILFSGPTSDIHTGIYIIRARSRDEATRIAADDPFTRAGHCAFELFEWDVRQALGMGPFSVAELDAANKQWRSAWKAAPATSAVPAAATPDWTAGQMRFQLDRAMEDYVVARSTGWGAAGSALVAETAALGEPAVMMIAKEQYAFFRVLASAPDCRRVLDVGTFTGLSALAFADGMGTRGRVTTIDRNAAWADVARRHWAAAGVADRIEMTIGEASDAMAALVAERDARYDIVFIDVDKARVADYFEHALALLAPGGLVLVDNALWHGWVQDRSRTDADTEGMRRFNDGIAADARVEAALLPIADGLWLIRRRG